jgi:hypothetical protein
MKNIYNILKKHVPTVAIIVLLVVLVALLYSFISSFRFDYQHGELHPAYYYHDRSLIPIQGAQQSAESIQSWMTFDYINVVFKLPSAYLKSAFTITDAKYPNIRIDRYAKENHINLSEFVQRIRESVALYGVQQ